MANSKFEYINQLNNKYRYVKLFEKNDILLKDTWIVIRIDGKGFHKFFYFYNLDLLLNIIIINQMMKMV